MVKGNIEVVKEVVETTADGMEYRVTIVSGFVGVGKTFQEAFGRAKKLETETYKSIVDGMSEIKAISPVRTPEKLSITFVIVGQSGRKFSVSVPGSGSKEDMCLMILNALNEVEKLDADSNQGGKYGKELLAYIKRLPKVEKLEVIDNGNNVRCFLKDGRVADSVKHPNDVFNIDLGVLWAYANATNKAKTGGTKGLLPETVMDNCCGFIHIDETTGWVGIPLE